GQTLDARTDVYLLGATLHHVLTGKARHVGPSMQQIMNSITDARPFGYAEDVPSELAELCNRATAQDPAVRPASAEAFRQEIAEHLRKRSARVLCDAALERLSLLESMLASSVEKGGDLKDLGAMYRHAAEARFGYGYALRIEPKLETALSGLDKTLRGLFDLELRQQHIDSAAALLDEMQGPSEELRNRLDSARQEVARQRAETERLRVMAYELDPQVEARWRGIGIACMVLATFIAIVALMHGRDFGKVTNADLTLFASLMSLSCISTIWFLRRRLLGTTFNRRIAAILGIVCGFILIHRALAWYEEQPVELVLSADILNIAAIMSVGTVLIEKRMSSVVLALLVMRAFMIFFPHYSAEIFTVAGLVTLALMLWAWRAPKDRASIGNDSA
ncbi:MAG TPA: hypothetical protein PK156_49075, partial [Polyangium sp.]|nr:hypothetical protein [Polyangium sp.]